MSKYVSFAIVAAFLIALPYAVWAESSSSSYILWGNAVTGGGNYSTSANFRLFQSVADLSNEALDSANYHMAVGFEAIYEEPIITMSVSPNVVALAPDPLTTGAVSTANTTVTVSTNADFGYSVTATAIAEFANEAAYALDGVADGSVTAGTEEFGIAVAGTDAAFGDDQAVSSTPLTIASRNIWGADRTVTVTIKAAIDDSSAAGEYSGTIVFIGTGNY